MSSSILFMFTYYYIRAESQSGVHRRRKRHAEWIIIRNSRIFIVMRYPCRNTARDNNTPRRDARAAYNNTVPVYRYYYYYYYNNFPYNSDGIGLAWVYLTSSHRQFLCSTRRLKHITISVCRRNAYSYNIHNNTFTIVLYSARENYTVV